MLWGFKKHITKYTKNFSFNLENKIVANEQVRCRCLFIYGKYYKQQLRKSTLVFPMQYTRLLLNIDLLNKQKQNKKSLIYVNFLAKSPPLFVTNATINKL